LALIVQVPAARSVKVVPVREQIADVADVTATVKPEFEVADTEPGLAP
jgi:hypothetical protein